ncbi:MAG: hypothetical protein J6328_06810 [Bacilli bacterium]|nr:hypothetical protein [Bacilli bacterium]
MPFVYTFASETEFTIYSEEGDIDATFVLKTRDGNTYQLVDANDPYTTCTIVLDESGSIFLTVDNGGPWGSMSFYIDNADITNPNGI